MTQTTWRSAPSIQRGLALIAVTFAALSLIGCPQPQRADPDSPQAPTTPGVPSQKPGPTPGPKPSPAPRPAPGPGPGPGGPSATGTLDGYKHEFSQHIVATNRHLTFEGKLPEVLHAVVVLQITVNATGQLTRVQVLRTPTYARELGSVAAETVRRAAPLPAPSRALMRGQRELQFTETWLFRANGTFQMRALAGPQ